jgi:hypothetical protein
VTVTTDEHLDACLAILHQATDALVEERILGCLLVDRVELSLGKGIGFKREEHVDRHTIRVVDQRASR